MLTYAQLTTHAQNAIGGRPSTGPGQTVAERLREIVNQAGRAMYMARPWKFREMVDTFDTVADQEYVSLGSTFAQVANVWLSGVRVDMVPSVRLEEYRAAESASGSTICCVRLAGLTGSLRVELVPAPTSSESDALRVHGLAAWAELGDDVEDDDQMQVPPYGEQLLVEYVRAVAVSYEDGQLAQRFKEIEAGPAFWTCQSADSQVQGDYGPIPDQTAPQQSEPKVTMAW